MENRPFDPEDQDENESQASGKKKRSSTFSKFLSNIRRKEFDSSEEDDDIEGEKPKRFRRLFSRLFPSVVENPSQEKSSKQEHPIDYEAWFSWKQQVQAAGPEGGTEGPEIQAMEVSPEQPEKMESPTPITKEVIEASEGSTKTTENDTPEQSEAISPDIRDLPQSGPWEQEVLLRQQPSVEAEFKQPAPTHTEKVEREVVVERGPGMVLPVALVGLEYLGRKKADKKLEARVNEKIGATNQEVSRSTALQQELEAVVKQNRDQLEALKQARLGKTAETAPLARPVIESSEYPQSQLDTRGETSRKTQETIPSTSPEKQPLVAKEEKVEEVKPQKILEQVADAAEHNIAVERVFERSHEVKDDQTVPGAAPSVGAVMAARAKGSQYQPAPQGQAAGHHQGGPLPFVPDSTDPASYKQAMTMGFWAAVMIIILGSIAYLVIK